jgi:hypothetical protein
LTASNQSKEKTLYLEKAWPLLSAVAVLQRKRAQRRCKDAGGGVAKEDYGDNLEPRRPG